MTTDYITLPSDQEVHRSVQVLVEVLNHHIKRNKDLINLLYKKGVTQSEIAQELGVGKSAISMAYPKGDQG